MSSIVIHPRFCGPSESGNGGYTAGLLAGHIEGPTEVTLRRPPPLDKALELVQKGEAVELFDGELLVAEAKPATLNLEPPKTLNLKEAQTAAERFSGFQHHFFPRCFVCGSERNVGDGLRIFSGPAGDMVAAPWQVDDSLLDESGRVRPEFIWSALDCPGYFAAFNGKESQRALLGRMTAAIHAELHANETCVVIGWPEKAEGRKHSVGTAILKADGSVAAVARGLWITVS